ncbi:GumC family protein [Marinivivus vitaminiproducens]|uniref:GumC family protein n=1 Tax=Marinivivus vitaminiproducens TaxID=3035935 RepID=UPI0027AB8F52|nr:Wzz/FepE/Etk N-terminal domain-containing protein [Geminicoccaceae bacterium SCSIO 64248]
MQLDDWRTSPPRPRPDEPLAEEPTLLRLLGVLRRRLRLILSLTLLGTLLAAWVGLTLTPSYTAETLVLLKPRAPEVLDLERTTASQPMDATTVETEIRVIRSHVLLDQVADHLALSADPEFGPQASGGLVASAWLFLSGYLPWIDGSGLAQAALAQPGSEAERPQSSDRALIETVDRLGERLAVRAEGRSYVIGISLTSEDPAKAALIANTIAERYVANQVEDRRLAFARASVWLDERLQALGNELQRSEQAVQSYRIENGLADASKIDILDQRRAAVDSDLALAQTELAGRTARLAFIDSLRDQGKPLDTLPEVLGSMVILELRKQEAELVRREADLATTLGPRHPQMQTVRAEQARLQGKIAGEIDRIVDNVRNEAQQLASKVGVLSTQLDALQTRNSASEEAEVELKALEREAAANRQIYEAFLQRFKEMREQQDLVAASAQVISGASAPERPSTPSAKLFVVMGFVASATFGGLLSLLLERLQRGVRGESDVMNLVQLPSLALVPRVASSPWSAKPYEYPLTKPLAVYTEAIRSVLVGIRSSTADTQAKVLLVTSALPGEGKSTLALSLAVYAARSNHRVLLIDLDIRHPRLSRELNALAGPGVIDCLAGDCAIDDAIQPCPRYGFDYLSGSRRTTDPMSHLIGPGLPRLLEQLRDRYDHIIIDTAPTLAVIDAQLLAAKVDKVLFVVKWNAIEPGAVRNAIGLLRRAGADIPGVVLSQVNLKKHARYGYCDVAQYYHRNRHYYVE